MPASSNSPLIATAELEPLLGQLDLKLVDASWWMDGRDARADFEHERLPDAVFFDLDAISDHDSPYPHMLPTPQDFARAVEAMGISHTDNIIVYDSQGLFSAARVWWTFTVMGAHRVRVLDGGLPLWKSEGRKLDTGPIPQPAPARFAPLFQPERVADLEQVRRALDAGVAILDARGAPRFTGTAMEPRSGVRSGHMPGAQNLPYNTLLHPDGRMKRGKDLRSAYLAAGFTPGEPVITTCGSGVTAAILTLGLKELGYEAQLYDGSWAQWGSRNDTPVTFD